MLNLGLGTVKQVKLKVDSTFLILFYVLFEEAVTDGVLLKGYP